MAPMAGGMPPMGGAATTGPAPEHPAWTVPAGWTEQPPSPMLLAKFVATDNAARAEITVSAFPGDVGGLLANVNRWRKQVTLEPIAEADLAKTVTQVDSPSGKMMLVDFGGTDAKTGRPAQLAGLIVPQGEKTWFYKLLGDAAVVAREKAALVKFAQSVKYSNAP